MRELQTDEVCHLAFAPRNHRDLNSGHWISGFVFGPLGDGQDRGQPPCSSCSSGANGAASSSRSARGRVRGDRLNEEQRAPTREAMMLLRTESSMRPVPTRMARNFFAV